MSDDDYCGCGEDDCYTCGYYDEPNDPPVETVQGEVVPEPEPAPIKMFASDLVRVQKLTTTIALVVGRAMELDPQINVADVGEALRRALIGFAITQVRDKAKGNPQGAYVNLVAVNTLIDDVKETINSWGIENPEQKKDE